MELFKNHLILKYFLIVLLFLTSCKNDPCNKIEYKNGMSFKNGSPYSGTCINLHSNGEIKSIQNYKKGYDHGKWEFFYRDKKTQTKGTFNMGKKNGEWTYYYENGMLHKEQFYDNGKKIGVWKTYDENGEISSVTNALN